uniref:Uncharacterized protein n=1 Tax=Rhizophora mucronata TaxID=61149 RepID=A0A2P2IIH2_RHIMU
MLDHYFSVFFFFFPSFWVNTYINSYLTVLSKHSINSGRQLLEEKKENNQKCSLLPET